MKQIYIYYTQILFSFCVAGASLNSSAAPYVPANDSTPLEQLSTKLSSDGRERAGAGSGISATASSTNSARAMRAVLARDPGNVDLAVRAAKIFITRSRSESDPRFLGQAQAVLGRWWTQQEPPVPVLLLRATILQTNHDFANARRDLLQVVRREPTNAQAWLTLATVQQVSGDLDGAFASCQKLVAITSALVSTSCAAAVDGMRGKAQAAYEAMQNVIERSIEKPNTNRATDRTLSSGVQTWALALQGELAERQARYADAEKWYRRSLDVDAADVYTVAALSDFLLDRNRAAEVLSLIPANTRADILLLRRAIAAKNLSSAEAGQIADTLSNRFAASRARGDRVHLREESRFQLAIKNAPEEALRLAVENWRIQKEPLDARIALEAANALRQSNAVREIIDWVNATKLQSPQIQLLLKQLRAPQNTIANT